MSNRRFNFLENISIKLTEWIGTPISIIVHTLIFAGFATVLSLGADFNKIILIWNTLVSLEAIYLALFIQLTVNRNTESLEEVEEDIEDIQEDSFEEEESHKVLLHIGQQMRSIQQDLDTLRKSGLLKVSPAHPKSHTRRTPYKA